MKNALKCKHPYCSMPTRSNFVVMSKKAVREWVVLDKCIECGHFVLDKDGTLHKQGEILALLPKIIIRLFAGRYIRRYK